MKRKNIVLKAVAAIGRKSAIMAHSKATSYSAYQPKEPAALKKLKK